ncbi:MULTISPECIES: hypothetical protein [unclassified Streptomyces]|uniref:hypothetical protein n=1 Tax=unclassified Streptomyces TaxID=2593676 RepID=UPI00380EE244
MTSTARTNCPEDEPRFSVHFHDDHVAPAPAGRYRLTLNHQVSGAGVGSDSLPPAEQEFDVRAPQFTLDESFVHAVHPAPAASGAFEYVLPHITLNRLILPWERVPGASAPGLPWLALLLFAEEELPEDPKSQGHVGTCTVRELLSTSDSGVLVPGIRLGDVPAELHDSECATVDVPSDVFAALVPRRADLPYLCHVRKVGDLQAARVRGRDGEEFEVGDYAVVTANRFPRTAGRYAAHLVSLEGFADHLDGRRPAQSLVRMVSLRAWSFEAVPDADSHFDALIQRMADDPAGLGLRLNPQPQTGAATGPATERLGLGYVPVSYGLPSGERTFAWYRGPFTPVVAQNVPKPTAYADADEALVYLNDAGVFDVSYAAAFTLGRSLALSDSALASALTSFRSRSRRTLGRALRRATRTGERADTAALLGAHPARDRFHELIGDGLGSRLHAAATAPPADRATAPVPRRRARGVPRPPAMAGLNEQLRDGTRRELLRHALADDLGPLLGAVAQVTLLAATPLHHLVPDARMQPPESLRFFHVDPQWCAALRDGVLSTGIGTSLDAAVNDLVRDILEPPTPLSGLLMRSALVRNWPDVVVEPLGADRPEPLDIVDRVIIGQDLLLCLIDGVPDQVVFREPHEGIHFGIDKDAREIERIRLRRLTEPVGCPLGAYFPPEGEGNITRFLRAATDAGTAEILQLAVGDDPLVPALAAALRAAGELGPDDTLTPGALAVELVNAPQRISFTPGRTGRR